MFTEKDLPRFVGHLVAGILLYTVLAYFSMANGFAPVAVIALVMISFFAGYLGTMGRALRWILGGAVVLMLFVTPETATSAVEWTKTHVGIKAPRNNFDPHKKIETGKPGLKGKIPVATAMIGICPDGRLKNLPLGYEFDPDEACPAVLATPELVRRFNEQEKRERLKKEQRTFPTTASFVGNDAEFVVDKGRSGRITLTSERRCVTKNVTFSYPKGERESSYSHHPIEGCAEISCDGNLIATQCAPTRLPPFSRACNEVTYCLAGGDMAEIDFTVSTR